MYDSDNNRFVSLIPRQLEIGDDCPNCGIGKILKSKKGNLYCSEICWKEKGEGNNEIQNDGRRKKS